MANQNSEYLVSRDEAREALAMELEAYDQTGLFDDDIYVARLRAIHENGSDEAIDTFAHMLSADARKTALKAAGLRTL